MSEYYEILDPRPIAALAKYTYFLPPVDRIDALEVGDFVQVTVRAIPPSEEWDAERVWVKLASLGPDWIEGTLDTEPLDMPLLALGETIRAPRTHIINVLFGNAAKAETLKMKPPREYWDRCMVDQLVLDGEIAVHYIYRETPDLAQDGDEFPDSGWRVRGDIRGVTDKELSEREVAYVALGSVLNQDDSWLQLIDKPVGSAYEKDFDQGIFVSQR